jgi:hypothetical protein
MVSYDSRKKQSKTILYRYGGIQLGPDRFKHINNAARQVLMLGGFLQT